MKGGIPLRDGGANCFALLNCFGRCIAGVNCVECVCARIGGGSLFPVGGAIYKKHLGGGSNFGVDDF